MDRIYNDLPFWPLVPHFTHAAQHQASHAPGFLSSVAYRDLESPQKLVVLSRWKDSSSWNHWAKQLDRSKALEEMRDHLFGPITHRILVEEKEETFLL